MADNVENSAEAGNKQMTDIAFMAECFKYLQGPFNVDLPAMAEKLGYKNPASVGNRLRAIKKKWGIGVPEGAETGTDPSPATTPKTPRKGAKAARGPIKAKPEADGEDSKAAGSPAKRGRKPAANGGRKRKASETNKENEEPKTENETATEAPETTKEAEEEAA
ncbi:hypothetical protein H112_04388 [Trichophyton rubrum D6]|uniref:Uncharacterized protein n=5 Tax=Trichophyton TaxID=5550 RepID=F2SQ11_TRIRC|nr:uncharacterized protein TERG_04160 [Trichophyton rubrum CBS 118892]XP_047606197.1 uncharacterized protein TERG_04160 [Trichophyton rubrum CBS 118892]EZF22904.1 hypothetical protein H100_04397 [Trichophyton rubrum MR850]EZF41843.1 hypothetical protein H102_04381 [Trichophyton rubrum CBS 100081]EZF52515.1 hypothetical protein H103_04390 [Trichophyton rubrum CBS 288.86]EZF63005.1 hypothetical protein H104_04379 [Trichophyton rubrum CBS 289.86]EZF73756.1 hypothetical protein H105_04405 [Tricho